MSPARLRRKAPNGEDNLLVWSAAAYQQVILVLDGGGSREALHQTCSHLLTEGLDLAHRWRMASLKHGALHPWPRARIDRSPAIPGGLHHEVDVRGFPPGMRPQADVDLVGLGEDLDRLSDALEERTKFLTLRLREVPNMEAVAERFDDQGAHPKWPRAVLNHPVRRRIKPPSGQRFCSRDQLTRVAIRRHRFLSDLAI